MTASKPWPTEWKVGDRARCIKSYSDQFHKGQIYTYSPNGYSVRGPENKYMYFTCKADDGTPTGGGPEYFEPFETSPLKELQEKIANLIG